MERMLQYLDDLDDIVGAFGLVYERIRRLLLALCTVTVSLALVASAVWLALIHPPSALAACLMLFVTLLYRSITMPSRGGLQASQ